MKTMLRKTLFILLLIVLMAGQKCYALSSSELTPLLITDFANGIIDPWGAQANPGDISVVTDPVGSSIKAMKAHININEDFSKVANGSPRAEILNTKQQFVNDNSYVIIFKTYLPQDFQAELTYTNPHSFFQVHQNISSGSPQLSLQIDKNNYLMTSTSSELANPQYKSVTKIIGTISGDLGKWVEWTILYKPSYSASGQVVIWKNGLIVLVYNGVCAYNGVTGYPKFGLYKWNWKLTPTTTTDITTYFSNIGIYKRK